MRTNGDRAKPRDEKPRQLSLFEEPEEYLPLRDALDFYKHPHGWTNRLVAGDSLLVMNSLLEKDGMAGKVQMIYIDPPYGIRYGSNFQPGGPTVKDVALIRRKRRFSSFSGYSCIFDNSVVGRFPSDTLHFQAGPIHVSVLRATACERRADDRSRSAASSGRKVYLGQLRAGVCRMQLTESRPNAGTGAYATASQAGAPGLEATIRNAWISDRQLVQVHQRSVLDSGTE